MYSSGTWVGHWDQEGYGRQAMHDLVLRFEGDNFTGQGRDCVGTFTMTGEFGKNAEVHIVKSYVDGQTGRQRHSVVYLGKHDGEGTIQGVWSLTGDNGTWEMRLKSGFQQTDAPIMEIEP